MTTFIANGKGRKQQAGFTLIELIVTMMIMGILAYGSVQFILNTSGAYASSQERSRLGILATSTIERLSKEIKQAEPGSIRTRNDEQSQCIEFLPSVAATRSQQTEPAQLSTVTEPLLLAASPVSVCWVNKHLYRYSHYPTSTEQPLPAQLPSTTLTGRVLLADGIQTPERMFQLVENGLGQSQWVLVTLDFFGQNDHLVIQQEIGLPKINPLPSSKAGSL